MEDSKPNIHFEIDERPLNGGFSPMNINTYSYILLFSLFLIGFIIYKWLNTINTESILDDLEKQIVLLKNNITFYKNQVLLKLNMEGNAIKTTRPTSYSSFSKNGEISL
jgi:hypothetical protein